jgi:hypothetical protein
LEWKLQILYVWGWWCELDHINKAISRSKFTRSPISHNSLPWYIHNIVSLQPCEITPPIMQLWGAKWRVLTQAIRDQYGI